MNSVVIGIAEASVPRDDPAAAGERGPAMGREKPFAGLHGVVAPMVGAAADIKAVPFAQDWAPGMVETRPGAIIATAALA